MNPRPILALAALALVSLPVRAQTGGTLPLASVGNGLNWVQPGEDIRIVVPPGAVSAPVNLEVYSPGLNLNDYVNERAVVGYYGDEIYGKNLPFSSLFTITGPVAPGPSSPGEAAAVNTGAAGRTNAPALTGPRLLERRYSNTTQHVWERLIGTPLAAGTYALRVTSIGKGKNAFAVRVAAPVRLESSQFTVNARGRPGQDLLAARVSVGRELIGKVVEVTNYDGDGPAELELYALTPDGRRRALTISRNAGSATDRFTITSALVGEWSLVTRLPAGVSQYSNAFNIRLRADNEPLYAGLPAFIPPSGARVLEPVIVEVVDPAGRPIPGAAYSLGGGNTERTASPSLPGGYAPVSATILEGQGRVLSPTEVRVTPGAARVRFVARLIRGTLTVETVAVLGPIRVPLTGLPFTVSGRSLRSPANLSLAPGDYPVLPTSVPGSSVAPSTGTVVNGQTRRVVLEYRVETALKLVVSPDTLEACQTGQLTATASTDFPYAVPVTLALVLPAGVTTDYPLQAGADLVAGRAAVVKVPARVCASGTVKAQLDPTGLATTGQVQVRPPAGLNLSKVTSLAGTTVRLTKSLAPVSGGYAVTVTLTVEREVDDLRFTDALPAGGTTPAVRGPAGFRVGSGAAATVRLEGNTVRLGRLSPGTYTLTYALFTDLPSATVVTDPDLSWSEVPR